jgi:ABC-2 type transport system permease protein
LTIRSVFDRQNILRGINPIIVKELRSRMRGARAFITLTVALVLTAIFSFFLYRLAVANSQYAYSPLSPQIGQTLFAGLIFLELMIVSAITPAITAGAISGEKERQTYEMLLATPLHPLNILWGKLVSALSYVLLLVFVAVPMSSLIFIFGGVTARDMLKTLAILTVIAAMFGVMGLFMSALFERTGRATTAAYLLVMSMLIGPIFIAAAASALSQPEIPRWFLALSPISALSSTLSSSVNQQRMFDIIGWLGSPVKWMWGAPAISQTEIPRPLYHYSLPIYATITFVLYAITTRLVKLSDRWKIQWTEVLLILIVVIGFVGLVFLAYLATTSRYENFLQMAR